MAEIKKVTQNVGENVKKKELSDVGGSVKCCKYLRKMSGGYF